MGSSLIFLGIGIVLFLITFGIMVNVASAVLGSVFNALDVMVKFAGVQGSWLETYQSINETSQLLILMIMSLGIVLIVVKVIMVASARGAN